MIPRNPNFFFTNGRGLSSAPTRTPNGRPLVPPIGEHPTIALSNIPKWNSRSSSAPPSRRSCCALLFQIRIPRTRTGSGRWAQLVFLAAYRHLSTSPQVLPSPSAPLESSSLDRAGEALLCAFGFGAGPIYPECKRCESLPRSPSSGVLLSSLASLSPSFICLRPTLTPTPPHFTAT